MKNHKGKSLKDPQKAQIQSKSQQSSSNNNEKSIEKDIQNEQLNDQGGTVDLNKKDELLSKAKETTCDSNIQDNNKMKLVDIKDEAEIKLQNPKECTSSQQVIKPKVTDIKPSIISTYNGDSCDQYSWSQGVLDVQIQISLPQNTSAKKVKIIIFS